jgi:copper homeostasis protein (lipoprotein)
MKTPGIHFRRVLVLVGLLIVSLFVPDAHGAEQPSKPIGKPLKTVPLGVLPASFVGELPCADCPGIHYHLNLLPDRVFFLRMTYLERGDAHFDDIGSWVISSDGSTLVLKGGRDAPEMFAIKGRDMLRKLDIEGREIASSLNYDLRKTKTVEPLEPRLTMRGMYRAGQFTECLTRRKWTLAQEKDKPALEAAYKSRQTTGEELLVNLEGQFVMRSTGKGTGLRPALVVDRFVGVSPEKTCGARFSSAPLENTYWKLTRLGDNRVFVAGDQREPHFVLDGKSKRIAGSGGCNRLTGTYQQKGNRLMLGKIGSTFMACAAAMETEREFLATLERVRSWNILGQQLELFDSSGTLLARFEARAKK